MASAHELFGGRDAIHLPPWLYPPIDASPIDTINDNPTFLQGVLLNGGTPDEQEVLRLQANAGLCSRISLIGFSAIDPTDLAFVEWRFTLDGDRLSGYHYLPAIVGTISNPSPAHILVPAGRTLTVRATNNGNLSCFLSARFVGWSYDPNGAGY